MKATAESRSVGTGVISVQELCDCLDRFVWDYLPHMVNVRVFMSMDVYAGWKKLVAAGRVYNGYEEQSLSDPRETELAVVYGTNIIPIVEDDSLARGEVAIREKGVV